MNVLSKYDHTVIAHGDIDLAGSPELTKDIREAMERGARQIRVDLSDVPFMDSSGIRVLIEFTQRLSERGGRLAIFQPQMPVRRVLELSGVLGAIVAIDEEDD